MIDWNEILSFINTEYDFDFKSLKEMLSELYSETKSTTEMSSILGVSPYSLRNKMRQNGLLLAPKGGANNKGICKPLLLNMSERKISSMTLSGLSKKLNCSRVYIRELLRREGLKYKKERK